MFGYVKYDMPRLQIKDLMLYKALYCGLCKGIGKCCGQMARVGLSYDITFLSALLHNLTGENVRIEKQNCFEHAIKKRPIAAADELTIQLGALNTVLMYYKLSDDVEDKDHGRGRRLWFKKGFRRARKRYPELVEIVEGYRKEQAETERNAPASADRAAEPTANMMLRLSRYFLGESAKEASDELFYALGKWVYLIDALDDFDKDKKKNRYNPFVLSYEAKSRNELTQKYAEELGFLFDTLFYSMREGLSGLTFHYNRDLTDNVILFGIPVETKRVMKGDAPVKMSVKI